jgi:single-stranded-DNA-specific exonuclease
MAGPDAAFLGVERSALGRRWVERPADPRLAAALAQQHGLPEIVGRLLAARGVGVDAAARFLAPRLRDALPDPSHLKDMDKAAARLADAVEKGETVAVFGDYDVDGATSAALLWRTLGALGQPPRIYVPDRIKEGYGPNAPALLKLKEAGASLVVTVDCGATAQAPLAAAAAAGLDVIVVDHHAADAALPPAVAVVNPNRLDDDSPHKYLAAVGVSFLLAVALLRELRRRGRFAAAPEPRLLDALDLVALGTVCDVVPLVGVNRAFVAQGLKVMAERGNVGLAALAEVARLAEPPGTFHAGFIFGPRVNAGGRVGESDLGWRLLTAADPSEAKTLAERLDAYNRERQAIEQQVLVQALARGEEQAAADAPVIVVAGEGWHPGVIGIVASRLVERLGRPACVVALADGAGKGSGRSIAGVDLGAAVLAARQAGLLVNGGGHKMAAGFTLAAPSLPEFRAFLAERLGDTIRALAARPTLTVDVALAAEGATVDLLREIERLAPFGVGNAEPRFVLAGARLAFVDPVGADHLRVAVATERGRRLKAMAFRAAATDLGRFLQAERGRLVHLAGHLRADRWQGRDDAQFLIEDAAAPQST